MIIFKTESVEIDLSAYGVTLNEESNLFTDNIYKSYSLPFSIDADDELSAKLGLPDLDNITDVETKLRGKIILPDKYYDATLFLGEIRGNKLECSLSYGDEELPVYDMPLKDLPWPVILTPDLRAYAKTVISKSWPETAFQFPMVYAPEIAEEDNYEHFYKFINFYNGVEFVENSTILIDGETVYRNRNVLAPFPYLLEILKFGFSLEGKTIQGPAVENEKLKKALYMPENFLERFRGSEFQNFSFSIPDEIQSGQSIYRRQFTAQNEGTYDLKFKVNFDPVLAQFFSLKVLQIDPSTSAETILYQASSKNNRVGFEQDLKINITPETVLDTIVIELILNYQPDSISQFNQFELAFNDGQLNEFPTYFTLGNFVPDMTFGEFVNTVKNWLNLDIDITDESVNIDFAQESILKWSRQPHGHLEIPEPKKTHNSNRFYKLKYANGEKVFYNRNGQIYSELDEEGDDVITIEMDVKPAVVEQNLNVLTAVRPKEKSGIVFCFYDGLVNNKPLCSFILAREFFLQNVFKNFWELWLRYRVQSKTFIETFDCPVFERISLKELSYKYSELHVLKKIKRKYLSEETMRVDLESETF